MAAGSADPELVDTVRSATLISDVHELNPLTSGPSADGRAQSLARLVSNAIQATQPEPLALDESAGLELSPASIDDASTLRQPTLMESEDLEWDASSTPEPSTLRQPPLDETYAFDLAFAILLSAVAGFVDTAGVLALYGLFTAHVTGGLVSVGLAIAHSSLGGLVSRLSMIVVFVVVVAGTTLFARRVQRRGKTPLTALLCLMSVALAVFSAVGRALESAVANADSWPAILIGATAVAAMAVQNTLMRNSLNGTSPTTIMTGNLTQVTIDAIEYMFPSPSGANSTNSRRRQAALQRLVKFGAPLAGFLVGVCAGAVATHAMGLGGTIVPTLTVAVLAVASWRRESRTAALGVATERRRQ